MSDTPMTREERYEAALREIAALEDAHLPSAAHVDEALDKATNIARAALVTSCPECGSWWRTYRGYSAVRSGLCGNDWHNA